MRPRLAPIAAALVAAIAARAGAQPVAGAREPAGRELYAAACAGCHAGDGRGAPTTQLGFTDPPLPDFTDCAFASREAAQDWFAVVHDGGPATPGGWSYRMVYVDAALVAGERAFGSPARRDAPALHRVQELFDTIDCGSTLGIEEALHLALETLLEPAHRPLPTLAPALQRVRDRIDAQCCEPLRLRELSALAGVSPTRLLRGFSQAYGLTPHRYQQSRRIARAKTLIVAGAPLAEVAAACGYADQGHLNRWFLRIYGTTPGRFRRAFLS